MLSFGFVLKVLFLTDGGVHKYLDFRRNSFEEAVKVCITGILIVSDLESDNACNALIWIILLLIW